MYLKNLGENAVKAKYEVALLDSETKNKVLKRKEAGCPNKDTAGCLGA